ncbi:hypothetical protein D1610_11625 [Sphingomonas gilva]|uniref:Phage head morphogenesis domain-containing protein n=1 Tax=Sphingomonas gilva TaxID=2305907 RepID=A0A396RPK5_9SPHN|nr:phage minor head protein [Sphingomonas gilva]RHW17192.1 hypothetical protein D1610_11625 [Sphingomonas gilva]
MAETPERSGSGAISPIPLVEQQEALRYFRAKGLEIGFSWLDVWQEEHARSFTVAKAMTRDLLEDIRAAVDAAIAEGQTPDEFRKGLRPILEAKGWWGRKTMIDPLTAERKNVQLGSPRRLGVIYRANMRTAYQAGRWERIERQKKAFPILVYKSVKDGREREEHGAWHNTALLVDHDWWETHYPPCDWECRCTAVAMNARQLARRGLTLTTSPIAFPPRLWTNKRTGEVHSIERGIGAGWSYNVGKAHLAGLAPPPIGAGFGGADIAAAASPIARFLAAFGIGEDSAGRVFTDRGGWPLAISAAWFRDAAGRLALPPPDRRGQLDQAAETIAEPDEIRWVWIRGESGGAMLFRRYLRLAGTRVASVVDVGRAGWRFRIARGGELAALRNGAIAWSAERAAIAAYNPHQPRDQRGRWRDTSHAASVCVLAAPLTEGERAAIRTYTGDGFAAINGYLRGHDDDGDYSLSFDEADDAAAHLDSAIAKSRLASDMRLYRGVPAAEVYGLQLRKGDEFGDPGFTSTSKSWIEADRFAQSRGDGGVLFIIHAKAGTPALDVTRESSVGTGEYEVLFSRGQQWKVRDFDEGGTRIDIEPAE